MKHFPTKFMIIAMASLALSACGFRGKSDGTPKPFILTFLGFRDDVRTITVLVPQMGSLECSRRIQDALAKVEGVRTTKPDIVNRKIDITYDAIKMGIKNLERAIADTGFDANDTPAVTDVRNGLPPECR